MMCKKCLVSGRVQGVFYRATAALIAKYLSFSQKRQPLYVAFGMHYSKQCESYSKA